jgi:hypothetical protein
MATRKKKATTKEKLPVPVPPQAKVPLSRGAGKVADVKWDYETIKRLSGYGLTQAQIADYFGVNRNVLTKAFQRDDSLRQAYDHGRALVIERITDILIQKAMGGDLKAIIFYLKTKAGFNERMTVDHGIAKTEDHEQEQSISAFFQLLFKSDPPKRLTHEKDEDESAD